MAYKSGLLYLSGDRGEVTVVDATTGKVQGVCLTSTLASEHEGIDYSTSQLRWLIGDPLDAKVYSYTPTTTSTRAVTPDSWGNVGVGTGGPVAGLTIDGAASSAGHGRASALRIGRTDPFELWPYTTNGGVRFDGHLSQVVASASTFAFGIIRSGGARLVNNIDSNHSWSIRGDGQQEWGAGGSSARDTTLRRIAANQLGTDDTFIALDGIATKVIAGVPTDGAFATAPPNGTQAVDSTTGHIWVRNGGAWIDTAASTGAQGSMSRPSTTRRRAWPGRRLYQRQRAGHPAVDSEGDHARPHRHPGRHHRPAANGLYRLGIYSDAGTGFPGAVLLDAGTIDVTSTGVKEITISQAVTAGLYWLSATPQGSPATPATVSTITSGNYPVGGETGVAVSSANTCYQKTGVTGALAAWGATVTMGASAARVFVRTA